MVEQPKPYMSKSMKENEAIIKKNTDRNQNDKLYRREDEKAEGTSVDQAFLNQIRNENKDLSLQNRGDMFVYGQYFGKELEGSLFLFGSAVKKGTDQRGFALVKCVEAPPLPRGMQSIPQEAVDIVKKMDEGNTVFDNYESAKAFITRELEKIKSVKKAEALEEEQLIAKQVSEGKTADEIDKARDALRRMTAEQKAKVLAEKQKRREEMSIPPPTFGSEGSIGSSNEQPPKKKGFFRRIAGFLGGK